MFDWKWRVGARVLGWSGFSGVTWALAWNVLMIVILGGLHRVAPTSFINYADRGEPFDAFSNYLRAACLYPSLVLAPRAALIGGLCGFYAPARQINPLSSPFLRRVMREAWLMGMVRLVVAALSGWAIGLLIGHLNVDGDGSESGFICFVLLEIIGFILTVWYALSRALRAQKGRVSDIIAHGFGG